MFYEGANCVEGKSKDCRYLVESDGCVVSSKVWVGVELSVVRCY